jgi:hypothetical protein
LIYGVIYLCTGLVALGILELLTRRISRRLWPKAGEVQVILANTGNVVGNRIAFIITALVLWAFWPGAIGAAVISLFRRKNEQTQR